MINYFKNCIFFVASTSPKIGTLCTSSEHILSSNKLLDQKPMSSRIGSFFDTLTLEALYSSSKDFVSFRYPWSELWKAEALATWDNSSASNWILWAKSRPTRFPHLSVNYSMRKYYPSKHHIRSSVKCEMPLHMFLHPTWFHHLSVTTNYTTIHS
jgi:hypothetical protein